MKQTAVQWLQEQLKKGVDFNPLDSNSYLNEVEKVFEQAKQMEKEQTKEAWNDGNLLGRNGHILLEYNTGEQYYNETYKGGKQ